MCDEEKAKLLNVLSSRNVDDKTRNNGGVSLTVNFRVGDFGSMEENHKCQLVKLMGYFKRWTLADCE